MKPPEAYHLSPAYPKLPRQLITLKMLSRRERRQGKGASWRAGVWQVKNATFSASG